MQILNLLFVNKCTNLLGKSINNSKLHKECDLLNPQLLVL